MAGSVFIYSKAVSFRDLPGSHDDEIIYGQQHCVVIKDGAPDVAVRMRNKIKVETTS